MSKFALSFVGFMLLAPVVCAQPPKDPAPNDRLDALLMKWEKVMMSVESLAVAKCTRTEKDKTGTKVYEGEIRFLKPNLFSLHMVQRQNPNIYERFVSTGNFLYDYRPQSKKLVIHELDPFKAGNLNKGFQQFLVGMSAADAKKNFELKITKDVTAENQHYIYLEITPRLAANMREFSRAQLVLWANTMLPRRLWLEQPNGNEITWDLPHVDTETKLRPVDFTPPPAPADWEQQKAPRIK